MKAPKCLPGPASNVVSRLACRRRGELGPRVDLGGRVQICAGARLRLFCSGCQQGWARWAGWLLRTPYYLYITGFQIHIRWEEARDWRLAGWAGSTMTRGGTYIHDTHYAAHSFSPAKQWIGALKEERRGSAWLLGIKVLGMDDGVDGIRKFIVHKPSRLLLTYGGMGRWYVSM